MPSQPPIFSVVIPTYNAEQYIENTIRSVLAQTHPSYEIIVSDDGSEDQTSRLIWALAEKNSHKTIKLLFGSHQGPGATRNRGIEAAKGEWIAFLDADDFWYAHKLEILAEHKRE